MGSSCSDGTNWTTSISWLFSAGMADDVRRPGYNGRVWVSRPIIGGIQQGPYAIDSGSPGAD